MSEVQKILENYKEYVAGTYQGIQDYDEEVAEQALYTLLVEKMPPMIAIVEIPDFPESRLFAEAYAKGEAKGHNEAVALMESAINELFGRTE